MGYFWTQSLRVIARNFATEQEFYYGGKWLREVVASRRRRSGLDVQDSSSSLLKFRVPYCQMHNDNLNDLRAHTRYSMDIVTHNISTHSVRIIFTGRFRKNLTNKEWVLFLDEINAHYRRTRSYQSWIISRLVLTVSGLEYYETKLIYTNKWQKSEIYELFVIYILIF